MEGFPWGEYLLFVGVFLCAVWYRRSHTIACPHCACRITKKADTCRYCGKSVSL